MENTFYFILKAPFVLKISKFFPDFFGDVGKRLGLKVKVNPKIYDVTIHKIYTSNCNSNIARSEDSENSSVKRIYREKCFSSRIMQKKR